MAGEDGAGAFLLRDKPRADVGREAGNPIVLARAEIEVPPTGVSNRVWDEGFEPGERGGAGGCGNHARQIPRDEEFGKRCFAADVLGEGKVKRDGHAMKRASSMQVGAPEALRNWQIAKSEAVKGRPTKKDRRAIDQIREAWEWDI